MITTGSIPAALGGTLRPPVLMRSAPRLPAHMPKPRHHKPHAKHTSAFPQGAAAHPDTEGAFAGDTTRV